MRFEKSIQSSRIYAVGPWKSVTFSSRLDWTRPPSTTPNAPLAAAKRQAKSTSITKFCMCQPTRCSKMRVCSTIPNKEKRSAFWVWSPRYCLGRCYRASWFPKMPAIAIHVCGQSIVNRILMTWIQIDSRSIPDVLMLQCTLTIDRWAWVPRKLFNINRTAMCSSYIYTHKCF